MKPSYSKLKSIMTGKGYKFFTSPMSVNIIGIRTNVSNNEFNDVICVAYLDDEWKSHIEYFPCTTKPGRHWMLSPMHSKGTAIIIEGQYRGAYKVGTHNRSRPTRSYQALEQQKPMKYFRDNNLDDKHDYEGPIYEGVFKTNIHRASTSWMSKFVDKWSAGCQVITGPENWLRFLKLCNLSKDRYGNSFTYTLLNKDDIT